MILTWIRFYRIGLMMNNKLMLNKLFYSKEVIIRAIMDYKNVARIEFGENDRYYVCCILESAYDFRLVANEFQNYVLALMNQ